MVEIMPPKTIERYKKLTLPSTFANDLLDCEIELDINENIGIIFGTFSKHLFAKYEKIRYAIDRIIKQNI